MAFFAQQLVGVDWTSAVVQGGAATVALVMLRWFMGRNEERMKAMEISSGLAADRVESYNTKLGDRLVNSNERLARAQLLLVVALNQANDTAKNEARTMIREIDDGYIRKSGTE